jgi:ABC-type multidrug transport system ATPase subunit
MEITLREASKRYGYTWIFKNLELSLAEGSRTAILGANGSGKSTLLHIISGAQSLSEGTITWQQNEKNVAPELLYEHISIAAPYLELIEEFTLTELIKFHFSLKKPLFNLSTDAIIERSGLRNKCRYPLMYFSSGMKQRTKLLLALLADTPLVLLDEPLSNLDADAAMWYRQLIDDFGGNRTFLVCSNHQLNEYDFCTREIQL